jgi:hypothetical protein
MNLLPLGAESENAMNIEYLLGHLRSVVVIEISIAPHRYNSFSRRRCQRNVSCEDMEQTIGHQMYW